MAKKLQGRDLSDAVKDLKKEHPSLSGRLDRYRAQRSAYDAKREGESSTPLPATGGLRRQLRD